LITFREIVRAALAKFDIDIDELEDNKKALTLMKEYINTAIGFVYQLQMPWMRKDGYFALKAKYSTGTITTTNGSAAVTGAGTAWAMDMAGQLIIITDAADGDVVYRILSWTDATHITLETSYAHTGGAAQAYGIYYDTYSLPEDFKTLESIKNITIADYADNSLYLLAAGLATDKPGKIIFCGVRTNAYCNAGTVAVMRNETTVIGVGTAWDDSMAGRYIQFSSTGRLYRIASVTDAANLVLTTAFAEDTLTGVKYAIDPPGLQLVRFYGAPQVAGIIPYVYWPKGPRLYADNDIAPIPSDSVLLLGAIWLFTKSDDAQSQIYAKKDFEMEVARLSLIQVAERQYSVNPQFN